MGIQRTTTVLCDVCLNAAKPLEREGSEHAISIGGKKKFIGLCPTHAEKMLDPLIAVMATIRGDRRLIG